MIKGLDPTPALPSTGEGVNRAASGQKAGVGTTSPSSWEREGAKSVASPKKDDFGTVGPSPLQGGGREGVRRQKHFNPPYQKSTRQNLRRNLTAPERYLWQKIRARQLGVKFRRQHSIGRYIVDFYCAEHALVIEVDGDSHYSAEARDHDQKRNRFMQTLGIETLRFTNAEVMGNIEGVILAIQQRIQGTSKKKHFPRDNGGG